MNSTNSEEDLYFEMEFDTKKEEEEDVSLFSRKSVESLGTGSTVSGLSQEAEVVTTRDERRGSSVGPILERPKYLSLSSRLRPENKSGAASLQRNSRFPKLSFVNLSVPNTPAESASSWESTFDKYNLRKREFTSSSSSVEETIPGSFMKKTRSRLSLNLGVFDDSPIKSPNLIPKFLRASFTKLMLKDKIKLHDTDQGEEPVSLPATLNCDSLLEDPQNSVCDSDKSPARSQAQHSPDTRRFVRESMDQGLPIIPFPMPTIVIAEKNIANKKKDPRRSSVWAFRGDSHGQADRHICDGARDMKQTPETKSHAEEGGGRAKQSLDKLLNEAKHQLEQETLTKRKSSFIRGYAANNSRALFRRRSSTTDYVGMGLMAASSKPNFKNANTLEVEESEEEKQICEEYHQDSIIKHDNDNLEDYLDMHCGVK